jgi:hypothetical protein
MTWDTFIAVLSVNSQARNVASLPFESLCATAEGNIPRLILCKMLEEDDAGRHAPYRHSVDELWTVKEYYKARCASQQNLAADVAVGS